jgi:hypothetical protein
LERAAQKRLTNQVEGAGRAFAGGYCLQEMKLRWRFRRSSGSGRNILETVLPQTLWAGSGFHEDVFASYLAAVSRASMYTSDEWDPADRTTTTDSHLRGCLRRPCTYAPSPAPYGVFRTEAMSVVCVLRVSVGLVILSADAEQRRPRRQHDYVRYGSSGYSRSSCWFWFRRDRLGWMVLPITETPRSLALTRQEQLISRVNLQAIQPAPVGNAPTLNGCQNERLRTDC